MSIAGHGFELVPEQESGTSVFGRSGSNYGTTTYYPFSLPGTISRSAPSFSVQGKDFPLHSEAFVIPDLTTLNAKSLTVSIAVSSGQSCSDVATVAAVPVTQPGTLAPKVVTFNLSLNQTDENVDGYTICSGSKALEQLSRGLVTLRILKGQDLLDVFLVSGAAAGW